MNETEIVNSYLTGDKSVQEIAEEYNTYPNKIRRLLKKHGVELKSRSEAQKLSLLKGRRAHPTAGKKRSEEEKIKISHAVLNNWKSISESEKNRRSAMSKDRWENMSSEQKDRMRKSAVSSIRTAGKNGSKIERFFVAEIGSHYDVEFHKTDLLANEDLEIDLYVKDLKTVIEIDGPSHFLPIWGEEKLQKQMKADLDKNGLILGKGLNIIRVKILKRISLSRRAEVTKEILKTLKNIELGIISNCITEIEA
jgi:very-short-patch-repair endonuclease/transposase-like protein